MNKNIYAFTSILFCAIGLMSTDLGIKLLAVGIQYFLAFIFLYKLMREN